MIKYTDRKEGRKTMKHKTQEVITNTVKKTLESVKSMGLEPIEQEFIGIQPLDDYQAIVFQVKEENGERKLKINVSELVVVLPKLEGTLDIFEEEEK